MKKLILILFLCLFTTNVFCEYNEYDAHDGRWWQNLPQEIKGFYIIGFTEGYSIGAMMFSVYDGKYDTSTKFIDSIPANYTYGEFVELVDKFYSNPQYRVLDIYLVLSGIIFPALKNAWRQEQIDKKALAFIKEPKEEIKVLIKDIFQTKPKQEYKNKGDDVGYCKP